MGCGVCLLPFEAVPINGRPKLIDHHWKMNDKPATNHVAACHALDRLTKHLLPTKMLAQRLNADDP
jgi:hypothetical protein